MPPRPERRHALGLALVALAACGRAAEAPQRPANLPAGFRVSLERTPCFGRCPEYEVSATAHGEVTFRGRQRWQGIEGRWQIPAESVAAIAEQLTAADFFALGDVVPGEAACGAVATDHPSIVLWATDGTREHRVNYYTGCAGSGAASVPAVLRGLAGRVDSATGAARLVDSLRAVRPGAAR